MIQSINNKKIKEYAKLIQKKERDKTNLFLVEGEHMVKEAFTSDYASEFFDTAKIVKLLDDHFNERCNNARKIYTIYVFLVWYKRFFIAC